MPFTVDSFDLAFKGFAFLILPMPFLFSLSPQSCVRRTAARTACAWAPCAAARRAGRARPAASAPATRAAPSTAPARTASASAARDGTESTAPLVGCLRFTLSSLQSANGRRCWPPLNHKCIALRAFLQSEYLHVSVCENELIF